MSPPARRREGIILPLLVLGGVIAFSVLWGTRARDQASAMVAREDRALAVAKALVAAEARYHESAGRYGWIEDLADLGLLPAPTAPGPHGLQLVADGYRLDLLLPSAPPNAFGVEIRPHDGGPPDHDGAAQHLAVVARPDTPGRDGYRVWYLDETGQVFVSETVCEEQDQRALALPTLRLERSTTGLAPGPQWRALDPDQTK